jgi:hypothetical protein
MDASKSEVESSEHQDNANIHCQPFPESVSEKQKIYTDYDGRHRHHVEHNSYLSAHFSALVQIAILVVAFHTSAVTRPAYTRGGSVVSTIPSEGPSAPPLPIIGIIGSFTAAGRFENFKGGRVIVWAICLLPPAPASRHQGDPLRPSVLSPRGLAVKDRSHISVLLPAPSAAPHFLGTGGSANELCNTRRTLIRKAIPVLLAGRSCGEATWAQ